MKRAGGPPRESFHELPLVGFTLLAIAGGGVGSTYLLIPLLGTSPWAPGPGAWALPATLLLGGLLFSLGHLGRPLRAPRALAGLGRSPLSTEVLLVGVALGASALASVLSPQSSLQPWLALLASMACLATLLALGLVYRLPSQLTWGGTSVLHPLVLGLAFGLLFHARGDPMGLSLRAFWALILLLSLDGVLVWRMEGRVERALESGEASYPFILKSRTPLILLRLALGSLLPLLFLFLGGAGGALVWVTLGLALDRVLFYGLGVRLTTEGGIRRVEEVLRGGLGPGGKV